MGKKGDFVL